MQKMTISYDEYDDLCEIAQKIVCKLSRLPTTEEIDMMTSCHIGHFLLLLTWLVENENGIPDTQENKQLREYVNDKIEDAIHHNNKSYVISMKISYIRFLPDFFKYSQDCCLG